MATLTVLTVRNVKMKVNALIRIGSHNVHIFFVKNHNSLNKKFLYHTNEYIPQTQCRGLKCGTL